MTHFPGSPRLLKGGLVLLDPQTSAVQRVIPLQYNPDTLTRTLQPQQVEQGGGAGRAQPLRLTGPPIETYRIEAAIDATDKLETGSESDEVRQTGIYRELAALELMVYPQSTALESNDRLASSGSLEIAPVEAPLTLFVWSKRRVLPVQVTEFSVTEEAFDPLLNPIRAKITLGMRILSVNDLGFDHKGGALSMTHHRALEQLAQGARGSLGDLGLEGAP